MSEQMTWQHFEKLSVHDRKSSFSLDASESGLPADWEKRYSEQAGRALAEMADLEAGATSNPDEDRMVGHYWLRDSAFAPNAEIRTEIVETKSRVKNFCRDVFDAKIRTAQGEPFTDFLLIGIGGSALGPQLLNDALYDNVCGLRFWSIDNTDPDGIARTLKEIPDLATTLFIVISKSGGTKETRNGMLLTKRYVESKGLSFIAQAVAVTGKGSALDNLATKESWLARFPMWDWVGGRTSVCSAVGLLPLGLQGSDVDALLSGAAYMDTLTRNSDIAHNPAMLLAAAWLEIGGGRGEKDMVMLPYKDRLLLLSRYLQQLVMESLGKEHNRQGAVVEQGIAVYGNKGSTDQHAFVQQLRDGVSNFFVTFVEVLQDAPKENAFLLEVEEGISASDYLAGFLHGTRKALAEKGRPSLTVTLEKVDEYNIGMLIALYERAVSFYASFIDINAYHQPGVEAGKKAAADVLKLQGHITDYLKQQKDSKTVEQIATEIGTDDLLTTFKILTRLCSRGIVASHAGQAITEDTYQIAE